MIHKIGTIIITLIIITIIGYIGLTLIRQFAFSIALENHEANAMMDNKEEMVRKRNIELRDQAASDAFRKVEPLIQSSTSNGSGSGSGGGSGSGSGNGNVDKNGGGSTIGSIGSGNLSSHTSFEHV